MAGARGVSTSHTLLRELWSPENKEEAWRTFIRRYQPLIQEWCDQFGLNGDDRDEVCSAVLAALLKSLGAYDPRRRFRPWLKTVVHNQARLFWRRLRRHPADRGTGDPDMDELLKSLESPEREAELIEEIDRTLERSLKLARRAVARVRAQVQPHSWVAYWQTAMEDRPAQSVARELGLTVAAVYQAKFRVERLLRRAGADLRGGAGPGSQRRDA